MKNMTMRGLQLLLVVSIVSNSASSFSLLPPKTFGVHRSRSTSIALQHINCNSIKGYHRRRGKISSNVDCRSSSSTSLSAIPSISTITTSISGFYKASPLLAGVIVGLISRITQYSSRKDTKLRLNNKYSNNSNFAMRALCSGLVLGILFEIMIHGSIIFSILFGSTASIANGSINVMSIARSIM